MVGWATQIPLQRMKGTFFQLVGVRPLLNKPASPKGMPASGSSLHSVTDDFIPEIKSGAYSQLKICLKGLRSLHLPFYWLTPPWANPASSYSFKGCWLVPKAFLINFLNDNLQLRECSGNWYWKNNINLFRCLKDLFSNKHSMPTIITVWYIVAFGKWGGVS